MEATDEKPPSAIALRQGYEPPDLNVKGLLVFLIIFLLMAVVIHVGIWFLNEYLSGRPRRRRGEVGGAGGAAILATGRAADRVAQPDAVAGHGRSPPCRSRAVRATRMEVRPGDRLGRHPRLHREPAGRTV